MDRAVGRARRYRLAPQASTSRLERSTQVIDIILVYLKHPGPPGRLPTARQVAQLQRSIDRMAETATETPPNRIETASRDEFR